MNQLHKSMNTHPYIKEFNPFRNTAGMPLGVPQMPRLVSPPPRQAPTKEEPPQLPSAGLKRAVNYYADYAGCGWWRMIAPETLMNLDNKAVVNGLTTMIVDANFYQAVDAVRLQRQASPVQLKFVEFLKAASNKHDFRMIYEVDDVIFKDDIPEFNRCKVAFEDPEIYKSSLEMMKIADEISVTCQFMKEYYIDKTGNKNVTVLPNYPAKMWLDGHYHPGKIMDNFLQNQKRPRVAYIGSGTHIDVSNKTNQKDDFHHVVNHIIKTRHKFKWVFVGCYPLPLKPFIDRGEMEHIQWFPLKRLADAYTSINCQAVFAPLVDCTFNKAKSNIKYLEAACCGIPGVFQDLITYKDAPLKFKTGNELIDQLDFLLENAEIYEQYSKDARAYADTMWLDDHLDEFVELYFTSPNTPERVQLIKLNPEQGTTATYTNPLLHRN